MINQLKKISRLGVVIVTSVMLCACGNLQRQSRQFATVGDGGITIDASQRAVYSVKKNYGDKSWTAFCAEPSPDALSALASSFGLDASIGTAAASKALGLSTNNLDSTASIGLRTQTIQLLRDAMYRLCEGYASGALDDTGFTRLQRRYQHIMLSLLAIEQLTGPVIAQQVALSGSSNASLGKGLTEISKALAAGAAEKAEAKLALEDAIAADKVAQDAADKDATKKKLAPSEATVAAQKKFEASKIYYATLEASLKDAQRIVQTASSTATSITLNSTHANATGTSTIVAVAAIIKDIVTTTIQHDYTKDLCADLLLSKNGDDVVAAKTFAAIAPMCAVAFEMKGEILKVFFENVQVRTAAVEARAKASPPPPSVKSN
jgi:hypothetical protein